MDETSGRSALARALLVGRETSTSRSGRPMSLQDVATALHVSKTAVSDYEKGRRVLPADLVPAFADQLGLARDELAALQRRAAQEDLRGRHPDLDVAPDAEPGSDRDPLVTVPRGRRPGRRALVGTVAVVLVALGTTAALTRDPGGRAATVRFTQPGAAAADVTLVSGEVRNLPADTDLWLDEQVEGESNHHPTEQPCEVHGTDFRFTTLHLGGAGDVGKTFTITVLAVRRDSPAEQALIDYAGRPSSPDQYTGLATLPEGVTAIGRRTTRRG